MDRRRRNSINSISSVTALTDAGVYGARFTVNPGLVWAQDLGSRHGITR